MTQMYADVFSKMLLIWKDKKYKYDLLRGNLKNIYFHIFDIMQNLEFNHKLNNINNEQFNDNMEKLEKIKDKYLDIMEYLDSDNCKIINIEDYYFEYNEKLNNIQKELIYILKITGNKSIISLLNLELDIELSNFDIKLYKLLSFYDRIFDCYSYQKYNLEDIIENKTTNNNSNNNSIVKYNIFTDIIKLDLDEKNKDIEMINKLIQNKNEFIYFSPVLNNLNISLNEKINGSKMYIHLQHFNIVIVLKGIFQDDSLNMIFMIDFLQDKYKQLQESIENLSINNSAFKKNYLKQLSLRDFMCLSVDELVNNCIEKYNLLKQYRNKTISSLVKEFISSQNYQQREILSLFLMCEDDQESQYLSYLLYDMISNESFLTKPQICSENIYNSLPWTLKKSFKIAINHINNMQQQSNEEYEIPYDKRIMLCKCNENVKKKAMDKLKEIQSKNGENCAKAQNWLDGLLRIPFKTFVTEPILSFLSNYKLKISSQINQISNLDNQEIKEIIDYCQEIKNKNISVYQVEKYLNMIEHKLSNQNNPIYKIINQLINSIENTNTKKNCNDFIKYLKDLLIENQLFDNYIDNEIFKSKFKQNNLTEMKNKLIGFISNDLSLLNLEQIKLLLNHLGIEYDEENKETELLPVFKNIYDKNKNLLNEWNQYKLDKKKYLDEVKLALDKAIYGHEEAKSQIHRVIAQWATGEQNGYVFGFQGPPGCGKTSLAKKGLTKCLKDENGNSRPFAFVALGGSCNGSTLEGHNYTYVGSTWGRICDILMESKCLNPIIFIDELDKVSESPQGKEIIGILTHMTDPTQNDTFQDKYFSGVDIDLSKALIIFSYNDASKVDSILRDRIHEVNFKPSALPEKIVISKKYMIPELCKTIGFGDEIIMPDDVLEFIINTYTYEAGCRKLNQKLMEIYRDINLRYQMGIPANGKKIDFPFIITKEFLTEDIFIDKPKVTIKQILPKPKIGLVNGLYATATGLGGLTLVECFIMPSETKLRLELTGQQGDVMKESMSVAKTVAYNILPMEIKNKIHKRWKDEGPFGIHIHCPDGGTPKDGPSAGAAITTCIYSVLTGIPVNNKIGITGEIDLNGSVHAIGGLYSKVRGAKAAGCNLVLCPYENKNDVDAILKDEFTPIDDNFKIKMVNNIWEVLELLLVENKLEPVDFTKQILIPSPKNSNIKKVSSMPNM